MEQQQTGSMEIQLLLDALERIELHTGESVKELRSSKEEHAHKLDELKGAIGELRISLVSITSHMVTKADCEDCQTKAAARCVECKKQWVPKAQLSNWWQVLLALAVLGAAISGGRTIWDWLGQVIGR